MYITHFLKIKFNVIAKNYKAIKLKEDLTHRIIYGTLLFFMFFLACFIVTNLIEIQPDILRFIKKNFGCILMAVFFSFVFLFAIDMVLFGRTIVIDKPKEMFFYSGRFSKLFFINKTNIQFSDIDHISIETEYGGWKSFDKSENSIDLLIINYKMNKRLTICCSKDVINLNKIGIMLSDVIGCKIISKS